VGKFGREVPVFSSDFGANCSLIIEVKSSLLIGLCYFTVSVSFAQEQRPAMPPLDRATLPASARNLPLHRLSSGALTLLNRNDNLVMPMPAPAAATAAAQTAAVALDSRVGANIRLGNDPAQLPATMRAQAEPFIARSLGNDAVLIAVFQEGRFASDGGAVDCGYSASFNGGLNWSRALIPQLTHASGGPYFRATDPVVAFDLNNNVYFSSLNATDANFVNGVVTVSKWSVGTPGFAPPVEVYRPPNNSVFPDKDWMAINTFPVTRTFNRVVVTWTLFSNAASEVAGAPIVLSYSDDGAASWSAPHYVIPPGSSAQGSQPVFLPDGNLAVVYWNFGTSSSPGERLEAVISTDGGVTFGAPHRIANAVEWNEPTIRSGSILPSAAVDRNSGNIFVVYQTVLGGSPRIAFSKSIDGGNTWSAPVAISDNPFGKGVFNPAINVADDGKTLTAAFYDHRNNPNSNNLVDMYLALSSNGGATWQPNIRLTNVSSDASLAPLTQEGYMLGDYLGVAQAAKTTIPAVPVWVDTRTGNPDPFVTRASAVFTDYILLNPTTRQTALWYLRGASFVRGVTGPTLPVDWTVAASPDFDSNGQPDYLLVNSITRQTVIWYLNNGVLVRGALGPTLPVGWTVVGAIDFNNDGKPDYVLFNPHSLQTAIWYMNGGTFLSGVFGPTLPPGWTLTGAADFTGNGKPEFLLFNPRTRQTAIWYVDGPTFTGGLIGPTLPPGWILSGPEDFNGDGRPDYVLVNPSTRQTAIWFINSGKLAGAVFGPTLAPGYGLASP
jgi:BNR repeat-like domain/FG-GAP-like repeat